MTHFSTKDSENMSLDGGWSMPDSDVPMSNADSSGPGSGPFTPLASSGPATAGAAPSMSGASSFSAGSDEKLLKPVECEYSGITGTGVTYSCPWPFKLPSATSYSLYVVNNFFGRDKPTKAELNEHSMPCSFPEYEPNTGNSVCITWLGHASCLFTFFGPNGEVVRVLCDPIFCPFIGPTRITASHRHLPAACQVADLPEIHALCISHNHMDHMDKGTLTELARKMPNIHCFVPMGDRHHMESFGFRIVREMNWWERENIEANSDLLVTFTPASHWSGRGLADRNCSLWGSFVLESCGRKVFFAGDTGYQGQVFKTIGQKYGPFDLAAIPIGCYEPREVFQVQHVCPMEAAVIHREVRSRQSIGIHWGAFRMTTKEGVLQPPGDLKNAMAEEAGRSGAEQLHPFVTVKVGESLRSLPMSRSA